MLSPFPLGNPLSARIWYTSFSDLPEANVFAICLTPILPSVVTLSKILRWCFMSPVIGQMLFILTLLVRLLRPFIQVSAVAVSLQTTFVALMLTMSRPLQIMNAWEEPK